MSVDINKCNKKLDGIWHEIDPANIDNPYYLVIDADCLAYQAASIGYKRDVDPMTLETTITFTDTKTAVNAYFTNLKYIMSLAYGRITTKDTPLEIVLCFSGDTNYRYDVHSLYTYKGNRTNIVRPQQNLDAIKNTLNTEDIYQPFHLHTDMCDSTIYYACVDGVEADDLLGVLSYRLKKALPRDRILLCSYDKDIGTIPHAPCLNWRVNHIDNPNERVSTRRFLTQMLMGDSADNIKGIPNVGAVRARRALEAADAIPFSLHQAVSLKYREYFKELEPIFKEEAPELTTEDIQDKADEYLIANAQLLYIQQEYRFLSLEELESKFQADFHLV